MPHRSEISAQIFGCLMTEITVQVPDDRVPEFYRRFSDFIGGAPELIEAPLPPSTINGWQVPAWINQDNAPQLIAHLWANISDAARDTLRVLVDGALEDQPRAFTPDEIVAVTHHPKGASGTAGVLGQVGHEIKKVGLPRYASVGGSWHYLWDWDQRRYSMAPEVAALLREQGA